MFDIDATTKQLAILGYPVEHSFSPRMHNFISEQMGKNYVYTALEVKPGSLKEAVGGIRALGFTGVNVTAPYKYEVMDYIDEVSGQAQLLGSVNTLVNRDGKLIGFNTDAQGFYQSLLQHGASVKGKDVLILGAGGATKPISVLFAQEGAKSITIVNRTMAKAEALADYVSQVCGYKVGTRQERSHYDIVINTTSVGMYPNIEASPVEDMSFVSDKTVVCDMIYNPAKTLFLKRAEEKGAKIINGLGMLIFQGIFAYELFTQTKLPDDMSQRIAREVFGQ